MALQKIKIKLGLDKNQKPDLLHKSLNIEISLIATLVSFVSLECWKWPLKCSMVARVLIWVLKRYHLHISVVVVSSMDFHFSNEKLIFACWFIYHGCDWRLNYLNVSWVTKIGKIKFLHKKNKPRLL